MTSLYVDRKGVEFDCDGDTLVFREQGVQVGVVPIGPLERVYLRGDVTLKVSALGRLGARGIGVIVLSGRKAEPTMLMHRPHNDAGLRVAQYRMAQDSEACLQLARGFVSRKLEAQRAFLVELRDARPADRYPLSLALRRVESCQESLVGAEAVSGVRGLEGAAARAYFEGLQAAFPPSLGFEGRNRRPPKDPVNAMLSLAYTLLHAEAVLQAYGAGLDPFVGFLHDLDFGRESLACDLVEPLRVEVDRFVQRLFLDRVLDAEDFSLTGGACLLGKAGRARFYATWESALETIRPALADEVAALRRRIEAP